MSRTARLIAACRHAASHDPLLRAVCHDAVAPYLLPAAVRWAAGSGSAAARALRRPFRGLIEHTALRTAIIDEALRAALHAGTRQVVLLGAGLDGRAHRVSELRDADVIEVDRAPILERKQRALAGLARCARRLTYAPTDFARDQLGPTLAAAGHDSGQPTFWVWEGVTMYLEPAAMDATCAVIAARSAPDSRACVTYLTPQVASLSRWLGRIAELNLALLREPIRCALMPSEMASRWQRQGFEVVSDERPPEVARRFGIELPCERRLSSPDEHVLLVRRVRASLDFDRIVRNLPLPGSAAGSSGAQAAWQPHAAAR